MAEIEKTKDVNKTGDDWAILPFDEKEDNERWVKLTRKTDELAEKAASTEAIFGELLIEENLADNQPVINSPQSEEEKLAEIEPF